MLRTHSHEAQTILFVDDEPQACKWFARTFCGEFTILTAPGVDEALTLLRERANEVAVVVTDFRMPRRDGLDLLRAVQREFRHLVRLLATAHADKDVAIAAVNEGKVLRILEKPLDEEATNEALREALALYRAQALERSLNEGRAAATRETLGFLAHELNTPLATTRGFVRAVADRHQPAGPGSPPGAVQFIEDRPGEIMAALEAAERRAQYCQSLVSTFVQSARDAYRGDAAQSVSAAKLVRTLLDEFPFEEDEASWVSSDVAQDFTLPCRRDLLYLVMCTTHEERAAGLARAGGAGPAHRSWYHRFAAGAGPVLDAVRGQRPGDRPGGACPPHARAGDDPKRVRRQRHGPDVLPARDAVHRRLHRDRVRGGPGNGDDPLLPPFNNASHA